MKLAAWLGLALALAGVAGACTSDLKLALDGKSCSTDSRCVTGYECDTELNICVLAGTLVQHGGAGGDGGDGGDTAGTAGQAAGAGTGGASVGGRAGDAGSSGSPAGDGGAAGSGAVAGAAGDVNAPDGGSGTLPDGGCIPTTVYHDGDGDTYGDDSQYRTACPSDEWVTVGGDCRDDLAQVSPGQTFFFAVGYPSSGPGGVSFDYDCANGEQPDPDNDTNDAVPNCASLLGVGCEGSGFQPATPARNGAGIEPRCGSNARIDCVVNGIACEADETPVAESLAFRCR